MRRSKTDGIARCGMSRATPEATGRWHWATTCSILPQRPPGQHANKQQSTNTPKKVAMFMAAAVHQYNTVRIAQWKRSRALLEATGCHRWVSIMSNNIKPDMATTVFFNVFIVKTVGKGHGLMLRPPVFNRGITYQTKEKGLTKVSIYIVGKVSNKNNIWWSGCCIAFVFVGTVSRAQLRTSIKALKCHI